VLRREGISAVGEATMPEFRESITKQAVKKGQRTEVRVQ